MTAVSEKAAGVDNIVKEHLIYSHPAIIVHLRILFNIMSVHGFDHVTGALIELHWLPVRYRITYKLCTLMHGVVRPLTKQINKLLADKTRNGVHRGCTKYHMGHNADCNSESTSS